MYTYLSMKLGYNMCHLYFYGNRVKLFTMYVSTYLRLILYKLIMSKSTEL